MVKTLVSVCVCVRACVRECVRVCVCVCVVVVVTLLSVCEYAPVIFLYPQPVGLYCIFAFLIMGCVL